jgi:uncharacterized protein YbjT (DUF2867 family)
VCLTCIGAKPRAVGGEGIDDHTDYLEIALRLSIFGGTGPTGLSLVEQALAEGHDVIAYARNPDKLPAHRRLTVIQGQLDDAQSISSAITGGDAVLSLLGPGTKADDVPPLLAGYRNIVAAMREHGVRRLVSIGTPSMRDETDGTDWKVDTLVRLIRRFQPAAYHAIVGIGQLIRESELDWTIVRVPFLRDGPCTAHIDVRRVGQKGRLRLTRASAAAFILAQVADPTYIHQAPFISNE